MTSPTYPPVYVVSYYLPKLAERVRKALPGVDVIEIKVESPNHHFSEKEERQLRQKADILYTDLLTFGEGVDVDSDIVKFCFYKSNKIHFIHSAWAGVDLIMKAIDPSKPLPSFRLTRTATSGRYISEYVIAYILATEKRISTISAGQQTKKWNQLECATSRSLDTLTIGILGVGNIGKVLARFCKALGMTVWGLKRTPADESFDCPDVDVCRTTEELADVLRNSDYICNTLPSTPETVDLLSGNVLSHCQSKKSIFINVGRGDVIDEESIVKAIKNEWIGGAILDVFQKEPLPEDSPLWTLPNVTVTPHISGWSASSKFQDSIIKAFVENYWAYVEGRSLQNEVDFKRGY